LRSWACAATLAPSTIKVPIRLRIVLFLNNALPFTY
jgi:hypothetical protein